ncbi:MAG: hypothetical protein M3Y55_07985, partial [Pseudomonadota bacterium]|nr:hypothetical protein [Pseudomonadota bacterium]
MPERRSRPTVPAATTASSASMAAAASLRAEHDRRGRHALWAALALVVVWGANFTVQKAIFGALSPGGFLFARYLIMPVAAAALLCFRHGLHWPRVSRADVWA